MSITERSGGGPLPADHRAINPETGMQAAYIVLTPEERAKGFVEPVRTSYVHLACGSTTLMANDLAETYARDPGFYDGTFCARCRAHFSLAEFIWAGTQQRVGSRAAHEAAPFAPPVVAAAPFAAPRPRPVRMWVDTEFNEHANRHELISLALVAEDGREWYEVLPCGRPGPWVAENVIPKLGKAATTPAAFADSLREFLAPYSAVHVIGDWPTDIALFCDALIVAPGCRIDTPALTLEVTRVDSESSEPHNALADARGIRDAYLAEEAR